MTMRMLYFPLSNNAVVCLMQFLYVFFVGSFPFNSFLSGFFCSLGFFVLMGRLPVSAQPDDSAIAVKPRFYMH